jgi:hypothetical protein
MNKDGNLTAILMSNVAKEIIKIKFKKTDTLDQCLKYFYKIMRKYGIKYGVKNGAGVMCANFEWTMCKTLFLQRIVDYFDINELINGVHRKVFY